MDELNKKTKKKGSLTGFAILGLLVLFSWIVFKILTPGNFGSAQNMVKYFEASLIYSTGAIGFYFVMVMGLFDFSIGANVILSAIDRKSVV